MGHSLCGGVQGRMDMCSGNAPGLDEKSSFVGRWMDVLRPGYERLAEDAQEVNIRDLEHEAVRVSLNNLMTFPFVKEAVEGDRLSLHGLHTDIAEGGLTALDPASGTFQAV